ncbi:MAG: hypothetical protein KF752_00415 [Pirellulaceae bacterium]|nr:hypothetical protein [Pirellulaceae bacterium]
MKLRLLNRRADYWTIRSCLWAVLWLAFASLAPGQDDTFADDDPFGSDTSFDSSEMDADDSQLPFGAVDTGDQPVRDAAAGRPATPQSDRISTTEDPLVAILRERPPKSPQDFGKTINWMTQLELWPEVAKLLDQVAAKNWPLSVKVQVSQAAGRQTWIRLRRDDVVLNPAQSELVKSLMQAPSQAARDPKLMDGWIAKLADAQPGQRRLAQLRLQDGGSPAIERLLDELLNLNSRIPADMLADTIVQFGQEGIDALRAACRLGDAQRRSRVLLALVDVPSQNFAAELATALHSDQIDPQSQAALAERLAKRYPSLPQLQSVQDHLRRQFAQALTEYQELRLEPNRLPVSVWRTDVKDLRIVRTEEPPQLLALERVAQLAWMLVQLPSASSDDCVAAGTIWLQRAYHLHLSQDLPKVVDGLLAGWLPAELYVEPQYWISIFEQAGTWQMHGAALGSLEALAYRSRQQKFSAPIEFLGNLLRDARPIVRYWALSAIAALEPQDNYPGAEQALAVALEMSQLGRGPTALVVGGSQELCLSAAAQVQQQTSGPALTVNTGRDALLRLSQNTPIELLMIVDRVEDMSLYELMQRLRRTPGGGSLPVAVLTDQLQAHESRYIEQTPGFQASLLTHQPEQMATVIQGMRQALETGMLTASDREQLAQTAAKFMGQIASEPEKYSFYPLDVWRHSLIQATSVIPLDLRTQALANIGTGESQWRLAHLCSAETATQQQRITATQAWEKSVRQFGLLLSKQQTQDIYDLYNQKGPGDPALAKVLGFVLDVIEAQAGTRAWPDAL